MPSTNLAVIEYTGNFSQIISALLSFVGILITLRNLKSRAEPQPSARNESAAFASSPAAAMEGPPPAGTPGLSAREVDAIANQVGCGGVAFRNTYPPVVAASFSMGGVVIGLTDVWVKHISDRSSSLLVAIGWTLCFLVIFALALRQVFRMIHWAEEGQRAMTEQILATQRIIKNYYQRTGQDLPNQKMAGAPLGED